LCSRPRLPLLCRRAVPQLRVRFRWDRQENTRPSGRRPGGRPLPIHPLCRSGTCPDLRPPPPPELGAQPDCGAASATGILRILSIPTTELSCILLCVLAWGGGPCEFFCSGSLAGGAALVSCAPSLLGAAAEGGCTASGSVEASAKWGGCCGGVSSVRAV
jgi:hypothetical protein